MAKVVGSVISWQKVNDTEGGREGELFKKRKAVSRQPTNTTTSRTRKKVDVVIENDKPLHRSRTVFGFDDYFDDTESSRKLKALNIKRKLQEIKHLALTRSKIPHRNCISALDEKHFGSSSRRLEEIEQIPDKVQSFRALISPPPFRHDVTNGQAKRHNNFHDGVQVEDNYVKFKATSSDSDKIRSTPADKLLNEFQLTYEQDKMRDRDKTRTGPLYRTDTDTFSEDCVLAVVINNICACRQDQAGDTSQNTHDRQLNEFQLTYDRDRIRRRSLQDTDTTYTLDDHTVAVHLPQARTSNSVSAGTIKTNMSRHDAKRIIKRLSDNNTARHGSEKSNIMHSTTSLDSDRHRGSVSPKSCEHQEQRHCSKSPPYGLRYSTGNNTYTPFLEANKNGINDSINEVVKGSRMFSSEFEEKKSRHGTKLAMPGYTTVIFDKTLQENVASPQVAPTSSEAHFISKSGTGAGESETSFQAHLNALGASLTNLSSKLNGQVESHIQRPPTLKSVGSGRPRDLVIHTNSDIRQHNNISTDVPGVHTFVRVSHHFHNLSTTSDNTSVLQNEPDHRSHRSTTPESFTVQLLQTSRGLDTNGSLKQTNVKVYDVPQHGGTSIIHNISSKSDSRNSSFRAESPRQTNISLEPDILSSSAFPETRRNETQGLQYVSDARAHSSGKQRTSFHGDSDLTDTSDASNDSYVSHKEQLPAPEDMDIVVSETCSEDASDNNSLDIKDRNTNLSSPMKNLNLKVKTFPRRHKDFLPDQFDSKPCEARSQKTPSSTMSHKAPEIKSLGTFMSTDNIKESLDGQQHADGETVKNVFAKNVTNNKILASRTLKKLSERSIEAIHRKHEKVPVRSKSTLENFRSEYNKLCSSEPKLQEGKRPQSSLATTYSSTRHLEQMKKTQQCSNLTQKLEPGDSNTAPLVKKVHQLHQEVAQRLKSKENLLHGVGSVELLKGVSISKTGKSSDELSDVSSISDGLIKIHQMPSLFITSTPVKHSSKDGKVDEIQDLVLSPMTQNAVAVKGSRKNGMRLENSLNVSESKSQALRDRQSSQKYLADSLKKIVLARTTAAPDGINLHPLATDAKNCAGDNDPDLAHDQPSLSCGPHQRSEVNQADIPNLGQKISGNLLNGSLDLPVMSRTHQILSGYPLASRLMPKDFSNQGRASPAESLLTHLDNPSIVMLLQKLYQADHETRQIIMTKVEFFRAWQLYTESSREYRARKKALSQKSITYCVQRLLFYHFATWQLRASHSHKMRQAIALCHCHILTKGLKALRWSVSQSKHLYQTLQIRVHAIMLTASFQKWKAAAAAQRWERLENAFKQWRQYVSETQKIRHMKLVMDGNVMMDTLQCWRKFYKKREKRNTAFSFFRKTLLRRAFASWRIHFSWCREKKERYSVAVSHQQLMLMKSNFHKMVASFSKAQKARAHFRRHQFRQVFCAWRKATQICQVESQAEMAESREHWEKQILKRHFASWKEKLAAHEAAKKANFNICRKNFLLWRQAWEANVAHYLAIEATMMRNKLRHTLLTWRKNVIQLRKRHRLAVALIENCYLKHVWRSWRMYITAEGILKRKAQLLQAANQHKILTSYFSQWQRSYKHCRQEKLTKQLWSEDCARRFAYRWKLNCYRRSLVQLFEVTQPEREQRLMRVMFVHWMSSLDRRRREIKQADDLHQDIQKHHLRFIFQFWKGETGKVLTIKPLVHRLEQQTLLGCFVGWRDFVQQKAKCKQGQRIFLMKMLQKAFFSWRRQYLACQVEKKIKRQVSQGLLLCSFNEWWFLIDRKRKGKHFNISRLLHRTFYMWRNRATAQSTCRVIIKREEEAKLKLKRKYFTKWLENVQVQVSWTHLCVGQCEQKQNKAVLLQTFVSWRRQMQSVLIARAYQKSQDERLVLTLFLAWQELTNYSVSEAIHRFSGRIGLMNNPVQGSELESSVVNTSSSSCTLESAFQRSVSGADRGPETDVDRMSLLSGGLQGYIDDHKAKCQRLKRTITTVIHRLKHWPICVAIDQWKEFTVRQHLLKTSYSQLKALHIRVETSLAFRDWRIKFLAAKTAQEHRNARLLSASVNALSLYRDHRKYLKHLSKLACRHRMLVAFSKYFSPWLSKTQAQLKEKHVLHLWTSCTDKETEIIPLEKHLTQKLDRRSLMACFSFWLIQYQAVDRIRKVYHNHLLIWMFSTWQEWARERHGRVQKSLNMLHRRRTRMTFGLWLRRQNQSKETERRYQEAWKNYLLLILQQWRCWATVNHKLHLSKRQFELQQSQRSLLYYFFRWKSLSVKVQEIRSNQTHRLVYSVFQEWRRTVKKIKNEKETIFQFQTLSYTLLAKRLFHKWHADYTRCQLLQQEKRHYAEKCALYAGVVWRRKAQKTKGRRLEAMFLRIKLASHFQHWKLSLSNVQCLYDTLDKLTLLRNLSIMRQHFRHWRTQLIADHARKVHTYRVVCVVFAEWKHFTKASRERQIKGLAIKRTVQKRSLQVSFQYWLAVTKVKQSVQQNVETRLQIRVLRSWHRYTYKMNCLRTFQKQFSQRVIKHIVHNAFMNLRWRAEYCASLQEIADNVAKDKECATMRALFDRWKNKLNKILATRCYKHILAVRGVRQWCRFIQKKKLLLLKDEENWKKAVKFHHHKISKSVFSALKLEVTVRDLVQRRRQRLCFKYARVWKLKMDMNASSITLEYEFIRRRTWNKWRTELIRMRTTNQISDVLQRQLLSQILHAWHGLCKKNVRKVLHSSTCHDRHLSSPLSSLTSSSMIPVPVSWSRSSPASSPTSFSAANKSSGFKSGRRL